MTLKFVLRTISQYRRIRKFNAEDISSTLGSDFKAIQSNFWLIISRLALGLMVSKNVRNPAPSNPAAK